MPVEQDSLPLSNSCPRNMRSKIPRHVGHWIEGPCYCAQWPLWAVEHWPRHWCKNMQKWRSQSIKCVIIPVTIPLCEPFTTVLIMHMLNPVATGNDHFRAMCRCRATPAASCKCSEKSVPSRGLSASTWKTSGPRCPCHPSHALPV